MRQALCNLDATKDDSLQQSRPLEDILLTLAVDDDRNVRSFIVNYVDPQLLSQRQQEKIKETMSTETSQDNDLAPGTPMDYSSGEDDEDVNAQTTDRVKLSE